MRIFRLSVAILCFLSLAELGSTGSVGRVASQESRYSYSTVQFPNASDGFVAAAKFGKPYLLTTRNDGRTWSHFHFYSTNWFQFVNAEDGWMIPDNARCYVCRTSIYRTINGGRTWQRGKQLDSSGLQMIQFLSATRGFAHYNPCEGCKGITIETRNGGKTWERAHWPFRTASWTFQFSSAEDGYVIQQTPGLVTNQCRSKLYYTTNGGGHWTGRDTAQICYTMPSFANRSDGWMVVSPSPEDCDDGSCTYELLKTTDGGWSWHVEPTMAHGKLSNRFNTGCCGGFASLTAFPNTSHGWVDVSAEAGPEDGGVVVTSDGGRTWRRFFNQYRQPSLAVLSSNEAWVASGTIPSALLHTTNDEVRWEKINPTF